MLRLCREVIGVSKGIIISDTWKISNHGSACLSRGRLHSKRGTKSYLWMTLLGESKQFFVCQERWWEDGGGKGNMLIRQDAAFSYERQAAEENELWFSCITSCNSEVSRWKRVSCRGEALRQGSKNVRNGEGATLINLNCKHCITKQIVKVWGICHFETPWTEESPRRFSRTS